jgi:hypothetical protein
VNHGGLASRTVLCGYRFGTKQWWMGKDLCLYCCRMFNSWLKWSCQLISLCNPLCLLLQTIKIDFSNFDDTAAWPYLLDEFVDHMREKRGGQ